MEHWERRCFNGEWFRVGWSIAKAQVNRRKHGVAFPDAISVLSDPHGIVEEQFEGGESREKFIGRDGLGRLLVVIVFIGQPGVGESTETEGFIRLVSARRATAAEFKEYFA